MTASHWQTLPSGPVQLIGLPRNAAMGVTNPRVLHRRALASNNNNNNNNNNDNTLALSSAKRCLFGSPEPGEIQEMYREEMRRNRERFLKRYNYDIVSERFVNDNNITNNDNENSTNSSDDDNKLEITVHEDKNCNNNEKVEERLQEAQSEKEISSTSSSLSSSSSSLSEVVSIPSINVNKNDNCDVNTCNLDSNVDLLAVENDNNNTKLNKASPNEDLPENTTAPSHKDRKTNERLKPYSRQILITDYYNTRKLISTKTTAIIVRQLPKPQKAGLHEQTKSKHQKQQEHHQQNNDV